MLRGLELDRPIEIVLCFSCSVRASPLLSGRFTDIGHVIEWFEMLDQEATNYISVVELQVLGYSEKEATTSAAPLRVRVAWLQNVLVRV